MSIVHYSHKKDTYIVAYNIVVAWLPQFQVIHYVPIIIAREMLLWLQG